MDILPIGLIIFDGYKRWVSMEYGSQAYWIIHLGILKTCGGISCECEKIVLIFFYDLYFLNHI
jgi:hypothetical protein